MGKLSVVVAALGVITQWLPIIRGCPLTMHVVQAGVTARRFVSRRLRPRRQRLRGLVPVGSRLILVAASGLLLASLPALAYGSPPDPSWIQGIYDDADYDDVVILATFASAHFAPDSVADPRPVAPLVWILPELTEAAVHGCPIGSALPRAPPAS